MEIEKIKKIVRIYTKIEKHELNKERIFNAIKNDDIDYFEITSFDGCIATIEKRILELFGYTLDNEIKRLYKQLEEM